VVKIQLTPNVDLASVRIGPIAPDSARFEPLSIDGNLNAMNQGTSAFSPAATAWVYQGNFAVTSNLATDLDGGGTVALLLGIRDRAQKSDPI
jgi:hypothetical protein